MLEPRTIDGIMAYFRDAVEARSPLSPAQWLDAAQMLVALSQELDEALIDAEGKYRDARSIYIEDGKSAAEAEARAKASDVYRTYCKLKAKRERVSAFIQLAKKRVELKGWEQ